MDTDLYIPIGLVGLAIGVIIGYGLHRLGQAYANWKSERERKAREVANRLAGWPNRGPNQEIRDAWERYLNKNKLHL